MELAFEGQDKSSGGNSGGKLRWEARVGSSGESSGASSGASLGVISGESSGGKDILEGGKILVVPVIRNALRNLRIASLSHRPQPFQMLLAKPHFSKLLVVA